MLVKVYLAGVRIHLSHPFPLDIHFHGSKIFIRPTDIHVDVLSLALMLAEVIAMRLYFMPARFRSGSVYVIAPRTNGTAKFEFLVSLRRSSNSTSLGIGTLWESVVPRSDKRVVKLIG